MEAKILKEAVEFAREKNGLRARPYWAGTASEIGLSCSPRGALTCLPSCGSPGQLGSWPYGAGAASDIRRDANRDRPYSSISPITCSGLPPARATGDDGHTLYSLSRISSSGHHPLRAGLAHSRSGRRTLFRNNWTSRPQHRSGRQPPHLRRSACPSWPPSRKQPRRRLPRHRLRSGPDLRPVAAWCKR